MMDVFIKQHLSNIWSNIRFIKELSNTEAELKENVAYIKSV